MIFSSWQYLLFLPIVVLIYWRTSGLTRSLVLLLASYFFYMSWLPVYGILLAAMTAVNWWLGLAIDKVRADKARKRSLLILALVANLGCLVYYKYTNFLLNNIYSVLGFAMERFGISAQYPPQTDWPLLNVLLPLGISFFVFEFVHYIVDIYKGAKPIRSWLDFAIFAAFFPSQIAGPIKRFQDFMPQLQAPSKLTKPLFYEGMTLIVQGLFKKVAIADPLGDVVSIGYASLTTLSSTDALVLLFGFAIQVFCDFGGYTDIGRGSAMLMGIKLPINFDLPFLAPNLADFWRRWHISLSMWLRDYVYVSLGGSRKNTWFNWRNLFLTMVACGLWHGAAWHYVVFGCIQGLGLIVHREWKLVIGSDANLKKFFDNAVMYPVNVLVTFVFVGFTYSIFRAPNVSKSCEVMASVFTGGPGNVLVAQLAQMGVFVLGGVYLGFWLVTEFLKWRADKTPGSSRLIYPTPLRFASWTAAIILAIAARPTTATPFVYFQF